MMSEASPVRSYVKWMIIVIVVLVLLGSAVGFGYAVFVRHADGILIRKTANALPIPAGKVGSRKILYRDFLKTRDTLKTFLASPAARDQSLTVPVDEALEKNVLQKLLNQAALEELAEEKKVVISDEELRTAFAQVVAAASSTTPDVGVYLLQNFGWNEEDFRQEVLRPALIEQRLTEQMSQERENDPAALGSYMEERMNRSDVIKYLRF